jgi:hypothetical protein
MIFIPKSILDFNFGPKEDEENCILFLERNFYKTCVGKGEGK